MASKLIRFIAACAITISWCFAATGATAHAAPIADTTSPLFHHFKFFLSPSLLTDLAFAKTALPKYVADMNAVLAKNTNRQLAFDPETDIVATSVAPQSDSSIPPLPDEGFEIWAVADQSPYSISNGGYGSSDTSGAGVLAGMHWTRIYDPDALNASQVADYTSQISIMLHEMAHVFGAGIGEYYNLTSIQDTTRAEPLLNIDLYGAANDPYWADKQDFLNDPLLRVLNATSRADYLARAQFSKLTAAVLSGHYRNGVPTWNQLTIRVVDRAGQPLPSAEVKVWSVSAISPFASQLMFDGPADDSGQVTLPWGGTGSLHNASNLLRLIKVYQDGQPVTEARYVSVFDSDIAQLVNGQSTFVVTMLPPNAAPANLALSSAAVSENKPEGTLVGELSATDADANDTLSYSFCKAAGNAAFQINGSQLLTAQGLDYEIQKSYSICVQVSDGRGGTLRHSFTIQVNDLADTRKLRLVSSGSGDGWVLESQMNSNKGGSLNVRNSTFLLGNDANNRRYRSVLSFKTGLLADQAILLKVTLHIRKQALVGRDPFTALGALVMDVGRPFLGTSAGLQKNDFQAQATMASAGEFSSRPDANGWYAATLKTQAFRYVNLTGATQFRLRFSAGGNTGADYLSVYSGNASLPNRPYLTVEYELP